MQFTNSILSILLPSLLALGVTAQDETSVSTYYTTLTVSRVVETTTCTSTTTPASTPVSTSTSIPVSTSTPISTSTPVSTSIPVSTSTVLSTSTILNSSVSNTSSSVSVVSSSSKSFTTELLTQTVERIAAPTHASSSSIWVASAVSSGALPQATNGTSAVFTSATPSNTAIPYDSANAASASGVKLGAVAFIAAVVGVAQML